MKQNVNYISHHKNVNIKMIEYKLNPTHISLYNALFLIWNECGFETELSINRNDVMKLSKIGSANTYTKCLKELHKLKLINYKPSHNPLLGSRVNLYRFDNSTDNSSDNSTDNSSVKSSSKGIDNSGDKTTDNSIDNSIATLYKLLNKETIKLLNKETTKQLKHISSFSLKFFKPEKEKKIFSDEVLKCYDDCLKFFDENLKPKKENIKDSWLDTIEKLNRIDKFSFEDIVKITRLTRQDHFWSGNFHSINKLRTKKDGVLYITIFKNKFLNPPQRTPRRFNSSSEIPSVPFHKNRPKR